jgi:predicted metalloprotease with PDZ domain
MPTLLNAAPRKAARAEKKMVEKKTTVKKTVSAAAGTTYKLESLEPNLHTYLITVTFQTTQSEVMVRLPAWRPGRYQIQNYAANVQEFFQLVGKDKVACEKIDKQTWRIDTRGKKEITVQYKYYAGAPIDAGNSYVGREEWYFNGSNLFAYTDETRPMPATLTMEFPKGWQVATQLEKTSDPKIYTAPDYDYLIDSPTMISPTMKHFSVDVKGATIHCYFQNGESLKSTRFNEENLKQDISKFVQEQFEMMRDVPFKEYAFIYHILPYRFGHGVEHLNSTSIAYGPADKMDDVYDGFVQVSSHEFFHVWNVKRFKPKEFVPYDYTKESYTPMLYVSEGFTSYYEDLTLLRGGAWEARRFLSETASDISAMQNTYGRKVQPVALSSFDAWLSGYGSGRANSTVNFYSKGKLIAMLLDLEIRNRSQNKFSLDDVMRHLNTEFAKKNRGFDAKDFQAVVEQYGGGSFKEFFAKYVDGTDELPYDTQLGYAGLELKKVSTRSFSGIAESGDGDFPTVKGVIPESPAAEAGLDNGDMVIALNAESCAKQTLGVMLGKYPAGSTVKISLLRDGKLMEKSLKLGATYSYTINKKPSPSAQEKLVYESWLKTKWE